MYQNIQLHSLDYLRKTSMKINVGQLTKTTTEIKTDTEQTMKLESLYKIGSECELNSWPDSLVC